jgi:hypothetical protein
MSHAELTRRLQALPATQQAQVYVFVELPASRQAPAPAAAEPAATLGPLRLAAWLDKPLVAPQLHKGGLLRWRVAN